MIGTIRKHQKWLWILVITATILSFLIYFTPNSRNRFTEGTPMQVNLGSIFGEPITPEQLYAAEQEGRIFYRRSYGEWPDTEEKKKQVRIFAQQRLLLIAELARFHIVPTAEVAARYTRLFFGINPDDPVPAERILEELVKLGREGNVSLDDFDRFARHQAGQDYLASIVGMSGQLITPQETEVFYRRENAPMETELVSFPASNYYATAAPTEKDIEDFYTKRQADYRVPDRIQVNYIEFNTSNYMAKVEKKLGTNFNERIEQEYLQQGASAFKDENGAQLSAEAAKSKLKKQILQTLAQAEATAEASGLMKELMQGRDDEHPYTANDLAALAKAKQLTIKTSEPFDLKSGPKELAVPPKNLRALFSLREDDPDDKEHLFYAPSLLKAEGSVYLASLQKRIPSQVQPLTAVHDKVAADYRENKALELAKDAGGRFESALDAGLSQGKTFDTMCAAQFVRPQRLTPFSLTTASVPEVSDKAEFERLQEVAGRMHPGQCSPFIPTADGGFILYFKAQLPVDEASMKRDLSGFLSQMRDRLQIAAFNAWFTRQQQMHFIPPPGDVSATGG
jgi:hypothetical protein